MANRKSWAKTKKIGNNIEIELGDKQHNIFYQGRTKNEILTNLSIFVMKECEKTWRQLTPNVAALKREYLKELIDALKAFKS